MSEATIKAKGLTRFWMRQRHLILQVVRRRKETVWPMHQIPSSVFHVTVKVLSFTRDR